MSSISGSTQAPQENRLSSSGTSPEIKDTPEHASELANIGSLNPRPAPAPNPGYEVRTVTEEQLAGLRSDKPEEKAIAESVFTASLNGGVTLETTKSPLEQGNDGKLNLKKAASGFTGTVAILKPNGELDSVLVIKDGKITDGQVFSKDSMLSDETKKELAASLETKIGKDKALIAAGLQEDPDQSAQAGQEDLSTQGKGGPWGDQAGANPLYGGGDGANGVGDNKPLHANPLFVDGVGQTPVNDGYMSLGENPAPGAPGDEDKGYLWIGQAIPPTTTTNSDALANMVSSSGVGQLEPASPSQAAGSGDPTDNIGPDAQGAMPGGQAALEAKELAAAQQAGVGQPDETVADQKAAEELRQRDAAAEVLKRQESRDTAIESGQEGAIPVNSDQVAAQHAAQVREDAAQVAEDLADDVPQGVPDAGLPVDQLPQSDNSKAVLQQVVEEIKGALTDPQTLHPNAQGASAHIQAQAAEIVNGLNTATQSAGALPHAAVPPQAAGMPLPPLPSA